MAADLLALARRVEEIVGRQGVLSEAGAIAPHLTDWRKNYRGAAALLIKPATTQQVAAVVRLCAEARVAMVPQGGNTSLCGAAVPDATGRQVVINLSRMNKVRAIDLDNDTITVEAGCVLAQVQRVAREADRLFPLSLAAEGSCEIGGNLSTNAGGTAVLRYGNTRELTLGLEVVLPDGQLWDGLRGLRKDNTGYDLKQLFIGAEGTLGIITAAVLKLFALPKTRVTALLAVADPATAVRLLKILRARCGEALSGFEIMSRLCLDFVFRHVAGARDPFTQAHPWYVLVELSDQSSDSNLSETFEAMLARLLESEVMDAVIAQSETQARALWALREDISEAQRPEGASIKHDISVPVSAIPAFLSRATATIEQVFPRTRVVAFGHIGDGNIHYNLSRSLTESDAQFLAKTEPVNRIVHDLTHELHGSISAEHGLGQLKRQEITRYKSALELEVMRKVKRALDPQDLMNPGKVL